MNSKKIFIIISFLFFLINIEAAIELKSIRILETPHTIDFMMSFSDSSFNYFPVQTGNVIQLDLPGVRYRKGEITESVYKGSVMLYQTKYIDNEETSFRAVITLTDPVPYKIEKVASSLKIIISKTREAISDEKVQQEYQSKVDSMKAGTLYTKATEAMRNKEWEKAFNYLKDAYVLDKNNPDIEKALNIAQEKVFEIKAYDSRLKEALEYYSEGNYNKAIEILERFTQQYGPSADSEYYLGKSLFEIKDYKKAGKHFEYIKENHPGYAFISTVNQLIDRVDYYLANDISGEDVIDFAVENKTVQETIASLLYGTGFKFQIEDNVSRLVTVDIQKKSLREALDIVMADTGLQYVIENKVVKISKKRIEKNILSQLKFNNMSLEEVLNAISSFMNINVILHPDVDRTKRVSFFIENDEISLEEFFDLILKTNNLVAQKYNETTYFVSDFLKAKENSYQQKFPKIFKLQYVTPEEAIYSMKSIKKFREELDFDNIVVFDLDTEQKIINSETEFIEEVDKIQRYKDALTQLNQSDITDVGASSKEQLLESYVSHVVNDAGKSDITMQINTKKEEELSEETLNSMESRTDSYKIEIKDMISTRRKLKAIYAYETRDNLEKIERFISTIDLKRKQVLIAMKVMDLDSNYTDTFGIDTKFDGNSDTLNVSSLKNISEIKLESTLNFIEEKRKGKILASPTIRAIDGHSAKIQITKNYLLKTKRTFETSERRESENGGVIDVPKIEIIDDFKEVEVGLVMMVLPSVNDKNEITIDISVNDSGITGETAEGLSITSVRTTDTVVRLMDGETIVMGGLISRRNSVENRNVPLVSRLPGIGRFFRKRSQKDEENEMVIFMSAYVVEDEEEKIDTGTVKTNTRDFDNVVNELKYRLGK